MAGPSTLLNSCNLTALQGLLLDLIVDGTRDPARLGLLALLIAHGVVPFTAALTCLECEASDRLSDACTRAELADKP